MEIYYFSGTGNSLFVARQLQARFPGARLLPIVGLLRRDKIRVGNETVGFVFPVHALTIPIAVRRFLLKADLSAAGYIFAVATRLGTVFRGFEKLDRLLRKQRKALDAAFILNMYSNEPRHGKYDVPTRENIDAVEKNVLEKLGTIETVIRERRASRTADSDNPSGFGCRPAVNRLLEKTVTAGLALSEYIGGVNYFYTDERCTGCGLCERVCLSGKIGMRDSKPVWSRRTLCYMCFACINFCPNEAVQIRDIPGVKSSSRENGRYPHPYATVGDMQRQKSCEPDSGTSDAGQA